MSQESEEVKQEDYRSSQIRESLDKGEGNLDPTAFGSMSKMPDINQGEGEQTEMAIRDMVDEGIEVKKVQAA